MINLQRAGGLAALAGAATFIVGFALFVTLLASNDYGSLSIDPVENAAFLAEHEAVMYVWNFTIYVAFGVALVVLALALGDRLKPAAPAMAQVASVFGLIWAGLVIASGMVANVGAAVIVDVYETDPESAGQLWLALHMVADGLGGGNEIVGGLWVLLASWIAMRSQSLSAPLCYLGLVTGGAGVISLIPPLAEPLGAIFGLGSIAWFIWLGIALLTENDDSFASQSVRSTAMEEGA